MEIALSFQKTRIDPTVKMIVLRDYFELSESPQHRIHANIHSESIWRTLVTLNMI